jgi:hypothetical protein
MTTSTPAPVKSTDIVYRLMLVYAQYAGVDASDDRESLVSDLLADLMHYCNEYGINFAAVLSFATDCYNDELGYHAL